MLLECFNAKQWLLILKSIYWRLYLYRDCVQYHHCCAWVTKPFNVAFYSQPCASMAEGGDAKFKVVDNCKGSITRGSYNGSNNEEHQINANSPNPSIGRGLSSKSEDEKIGCLCSSDLLPVIVFINLWSQIRIVFGTDLFYCGHWKLNHIRVKFFCENCNFIPPQWDKYIVLYLY